MSGIVGIVNLDGTPVDRELLWRMTKFMAYRGPDDQEIWIEGPVGFGEVVCGRNETQRWRVATHRIGTGLPAAGTDHGP